MMEQVSFNISIINNRNNFDNKLYSRGLIGRDHCATTVYNVIRKINFCLLKMRSVPLYYFPDPLNVAGTRYYFGYAYGSGYDITPAYGLGTGITVLYTSATPQEMGAQLVFTVDSNFDPRHRPFLIQDTRDPSSWVILMYSNDKAVELAKSPTFHYGTPRNQFRVFGLAVPDIHSSLPNRYKQFSDDQDLHRQILIDVVVNNRTNLVVKPTPKWSMRDSYIALLKYLYGLP